MGSKSFDAWSTLDGDRRGNRGLRERERGGSEREREREGEGLMVE